MPMPRHPTTPVGRLRRDPAWCNTGVVIGCWALRHFTVSSAHAPRPIPYQIRELLIAGLRWVSRYLGTVCVLQLYSEPEYVLRFLCTINSLHTGCTKAPSVGTGLRHDSAPCQLLRAGNGRGVVLPERVGFDRANCNDRSHLRSSARHRPSLSHSSFANAPPRPRI